MTNAAHHFEHMSCLRKFMHFSQDQKRNPRQTNFGCHSKGALEMMFLVSLASIPPLPKLVI